ncbi:MAG TPA: retron system putative HNH endonuclease [Candidatus Angelobacter sp.]|nr:retron system putative HNH endonuclease [Candidatus Angelobacter sp.]
MRNIAKATEPLSLAAHRAQAHSTYDNYRDKQELRESLVLEQRGLCCYCLCRIVPVDVEMKIEHWRSQKRYPSDQLIYTNLLGACKGGEKPNPNDVRTVDRHCDTFKGHNDLSLNPAVNDVESTISYLNDGRIRSNNVVFNAELSSVLNLNTYAMVNQRKAVINAFLRLLPKRQNMTRQEWQEVARDWNGEDHDNELREYCSVVVFWIRKYMLR